MKSSCVASAVTNVPARRPSRSTVARSVICLTSSTSCETKMTDAPSRTMARTSEKSCSTPAVGRNGVGSSSTRMPAWARPRRLHRLERPHDGHQRALDLRQVGDARVGVDGEAKSRERFARAPALLAASSPTSVCDWRSCSCAGFPAPSVTSPIPDADGQTPDLRARSCLAAPATSPPRHGSAAPPPARARESRPGP